MNSFDKIGRSPLTILRQKERGSFLSPILSSFKKSPANEIKPEYNTNESTMSDYTKAEEQSYTSAKFRNDTQSAEGADVFSTKLKEKNLLDAIKTASSLEVIKSIINDGANVNCMDRQEHGE